MFVINDLYKFYLNLLNSDKYLFDLKNINYKMIIIKYNYYH